jgi:hypothetical protein
LPPIGIVIAILLNISSGISQEKVYEAPFGTAGNVIELTVGNKMATAAREVKVEVRAVPEGIKFEENKKTIEGIKPNEEEAVEFRFTIEKTVEIEKEQVIEFQLTDTTGMMWKKEIRLKVLPPETYELYQNYPNPFNPITTIEYQLPEASKVTMKVYDILGREVATLVDDEIKAGYHTATFDGSKHASGIYFVRITAQGSDAKPYIKTMKIVLMK